MGSKAGVEKAAAKRLGIPFEEWQEMRYKGKKWCSYGKHWDDLERFPPDSTRGDGRAQACVTCFQGLQKARTRLPRERHNRGAQKEAASHAVGHAIERGVLCDPNRLPCSQCGHGNPPFGEKRRHEYHHYLGYEKHNHLKVKVLCSRCHRIESRKEIGLTTWTPLGDENAVPENAR